ncbi:MAG: hypothetical protein NE334_03010 [Lentisphaeraceae bacterium]|nr:hypothetical protein [Lentisphaeraceae bacterium]
MLKLNQNYRKAKTAFLLLVILLAFLDFNYFRKWNNDKAHNYLNESITLAAGTYATCRIINGGVSTLQESSVSISPWGVGLTMEFQFLDPINDATERLSDATVTAMALLGTQKLILTVINDYTIVPFYALAFLLIFCLFFEKGDFFTIRAGKYALLLLLVRFSIPLMCQVGMSANANYFDPKEATLSAELSEVTKIATEQLDYELPPNTKLEMSVNDAWYEKVGSFFNYIGFMVKETYKEVSHRVSSLNKAIGYLKDNFSEISVSLADLFVLLIEKILVQVFILPLTTFFLIRFIFKKCTGSSMKELLQSFKKEKEVKEDVVVTKI